MSTPTFLGYPVVCNNFDTCKEHIPCRLYRATFDRNHGGYMPKRDGKYFRAEYVMKYRANKKAGTYGPTPSS